MTKQNKTGRLLFFYSDKCLITLLKCALVEEDMMMDLVQTASPAQPTEELTELGKCLMKHEVRLRLITFRGRHGHS